jgi:hypothetical protein
MTTHPTTIIPTTNIAPSDYVNPMNVQGQPGCKRCGGKGWREGKNPHPCNECAKLSVPIIDTTTLKKGENIGVPSGTFVYDQQLTPGVVDSLPGHSVVPTHSVLGGQNTIIQGQTTVPTCQTVLPQTTTVLPCQTVLPQTTCQNVILDQNVIPGQTFISNAPIVSGTTSSIGFTGLADCTTCQGTGYRKSLLGKLKPCKSCIKATGNCAICNNSGYKLHKPDRKCSCVHGQNLL